jgi:2-phospho-L-lactate guanylyltransferase (CobY/MobA/RfbA family)
LYSSPPHLANEARAKGSSLGAGFASLTSQDIDRASDMANAIDTGRRNAERQNDYERDVSESPSALRELGFWGIDREDW